MTEDQIERAVERKFDRLDARLMAGELTQAEYDEETREINAWAESAIRAYVNHNGPESRS